MPCLQWFWHRIYLLGLAGMGYGYGVNQLGHAKQYIYKKRKKLTPDQDFIFFDVGANIGQTLKEVISYGWKQAQIYSFEPQQQAFAQLKKAYQHYPNIALHNIGFGKEAADIKLYKVNTIDTGASIVSAPPLCRANHTEMIRIETIDSFVSEHQIPYISYLKLDIEGAERDALTGASSLIAEGKIHAIEFEFLWKNIDNKVFFRDFWDLLAKNYEIYRILPHDLYQIQDYHHLLEIYCLSNFLAIKKN